LKLLVAVRQCRNAISNYYDLISFVDDLICYRGYCTPTSRLDLRVAEIHPFYPAEYHNLSQFDIGLIKLKNKIAMFNAMEDLACLPPKDYQPSSSSVAIYGYGSTNVDQMIFPQQLHQGLLMYYPHTQCGYIKKRNNADNLFCARGASAACQVH
jgi:hypothetical protein